MVRSNGDQQACAQHDGTSSARNHPAVWTCWPATQETPHAHCGHDRCPERHFAKMDNCSGRGRHINLVEQTWAQTQQSLQPALRHGRYRSRNCRSCKRTECSGQCSRKSRLIQWPYVQVRMRRHNAPVARMSSHFTVWMETAHGYPPFK